MVNHRRIGAAYEEKAAKYLQSQGYQIIERNFRCKLGEIDLIAREQGVLVFLEVKYRKTGQYGEPTDAVTPMKQRTICRVADFYQMSRRIPESQSCRFDVVAILGEEVRVYKNAFFYENSRRM